MRLEGIKQEQAFLYMERYVDEGAKTYSSLSSRTEAAPCYRPESDQTSFDLQTVIAPTERVSVEQANCPKGLLTRYLTEDGVIFPVHPETWDKNDVPGIDALRHMPRGPTLRVAPTASTRTVLVLDADNGVPAHFIKLHYPFFVSRFNRKLRRKDIHNAVSATRELSFIRFPKFAYLPEVLGVIFGSGDEGWGYLLREAAAYPVVGDRFLIPCFALYAGDRRDPKSPPLIVQLIEHHHADPAYFLIHQILAPAIECWRRVVRERGLLLQSHAQNLLLEVDANFNPRRIVHRDFDVWVDLAVREDEGLSNPFIGIDRLPDKVHPINQFYSLIYDRFIGRGFFDYLLRLLSSYYRLNEEAVRRQVREMFHRVFPDCERFFPAHTVFYFSNTPPPGRDYDLEDMREAPAWR